MAEPWRREVLREELLRGREDPQPSHLPSAAELSVGGQVLMALTPAEVRERDRKRSARKHARRGRCEKPSQTKRHLRLVPPPAPYPRPQTRGECEDGIRPCPYVGCSYHLYLDVRPRTGTIKFNFPDVEPWQLGVTCALDVADRGGVRLQDVGALLNVTRERARQIIGTALGKVEAVLGKGNGDD
jgi:hypothetical protein